MNSPLSGRSGTEKVTSRMTVSAAEPLRDVAELDDVAATAPAAAGGLGSRHSSTTRYGNRPRWNQNSRRSMPYASRPMMIRIRMMCSDRPRRWLVISR